MTQTNLARAEAKDRSRFLSVDSYQVRLELDAARRTFRSLTVATFDCSEPGATTFIDLMADSVQSVTLNGQRVDDPHYEYGRLFLPPLAEHNELVVDAYCAYTNTGEGMHRFTDPLDGETYLYSQCEVADARRIFAVFDQPDLKASYQFTTVAPENWTVISCEPTTDVSPAAEGHRTWTFAPTARISSYIIAIVAGPYARVDDEYEHAGLRVPMSVYCRESMRPHLDHENIFATAKAGMTYFGEQFGHPYPFTKYDQLFCPEFNAGAMENVGCVTFNEMHLFRSTPTPSEITGRNITILHELAHMWFGNLVTMQWWDDLWLNESFAEWAATIALHEALHEEDAWVSFLAREKTHAYREDQMTTTHPISADMVHLEAVELNFDAITYCKGASVLKQLVAYVGRDHFFDALKGYFATHAWGNTQLADFLNSLEEASGRDLASWSAAWLETRGVNTLTMEVERDDDGFITAAHVRQDPDVMDGVIRPHRVGLGLYRADGDRLTRVDYVEIDVDGTLTPVPALVGRRDGTIVLLNDDDYAFAKVRLDPVSLHAFTDTHRSMPCALSETVLFETLWDMLCDGVYTPRDYVNFTLRRVHHPLHPDQRKTLLDRLHLTLLVYLTGQEQTDAAHDVAATLLSLLHNETDPTVRIRLMAFYSHWAVRSEDLAFLRGLHDGTQSMPGITDNIDSRWSVLFALVEGGEAGSAEIEAMAAEDGSSRGQQYALQAQAAIPTSAAKQSTWHTIVHETSLPKAQVDALCKGFVRSHQPQLMAGYVSMYHSMVEHVWSSRTMAVAPTLLSLTHPFFYAPTAESVQLTQRWLDEHPSAPDALRTVMTKNRDRLARVVAAREAAARLA